MELPQKNKKGLASVILAPIRPKAKGVIVNTFLI